MKVVKGWGGFHLWRAVQGGGPKGVSHRLRGSIVGIDCGDRLRGSIAEDRLRGSIAEDRLQGSEGERLRGAMRSSWNFPTVSAGEKLKERKCGDRLQDRLRGSIAGIDCGGSIAGERGREIAGSDEKFLEFSNGKCGREIERKKVRDVITVASLKR
ncbi:hypothetical protein AAG906_007520 [Vitis piasezkii]